ncbi:ABC transporter permease [Intrasporangium sp.]|uniref:ABC transporter permease n=1 Tax=Intrasporangium sp. TaxID=1925024 RepID=UPI0029396E02|nr:ABC transporter permease subunit [Intrasporangium sp.]MDV3220643.1 ABC transporter permease [Intrasporangium sp.]
MTWLIWRQHRGEVFAAAVVLTVLGVLLLVHGVPMHEAHERDGIGACHVQIFAADPGSCVQTLRSFENSWAGLPGQFAGWLPFLPMLAGMMIGAPLLAREFEQGTWQLAWTQGVTRRRWLTSKLALVLGGVGAVSVAFAAGASWWFGPLAPQRFTTAKFNHAVLVFPAYVIVAVAIAILAGAVVRRTVVAAAITVVGYLAVRLPVEFYLRPRYREPATTEDPSVAAQGLIVHDGGFGGPVPGSAVARDQIRYHPDDRFWEFQLIETAILLCITTLLLVTTWRIVLGRKARATPGERFTHLLLTRRGRVRNRSTTSQPPPPRAAHSEEQPTPSITLPRPRPVRWSSPQRSTG